MAYTTIKKSKDHFDGKIYLGSSSAVTVTGLEFQPDLVWVKDRDNGNNHCLVDAVRGTGKYISSNLGSAEINNSSQSISAFTSDGFTTGINNPANEPASTTKGFMSWNWLANGTGVANTDGSISSTVSANTTSGFSIVSYTGTGANATVGHGLSAVPYMMIIKKRNSATSSNWMVYHKSISGTGDGHLWLDLTNGRSTDVNSWNNTAPTSSVFSIGTRSENNASGSTYIAYCFAEKQGYSKFGSFVGSSSQQFVYLGFKPRWFLWKNTSQGNSTFDHWGMVDTARQTPNGATDGYLRANQSSAESSFSGNGLFFLSNGIQFNNTGRYNNNSGDTYIFMAFAENPFVSSSGVPACAR